MHSRPKPMKLRIGLLGFTRPRPRRQSPRSSPSVTRPPRRHLLMLKRRRIRSIAPQREIAPRGKDATRRNLGHHQLLHRPFVRLMKDNPRPKKGCSGRRAYSAKPSGRSHGVLDGNAVRFTSLEAWWLVDGAWRPISPDEVLLNAAVMRETRFNQLFQKLPRLPSNAFKSDNQD